MKHAIAVCLLLSFMAVIPARAAGRLAEIELIDRDTGQQLEAYYHRGEYWVAGAPGAHYAIYVRNHLGERLLAVTSVDGLNIITGQSAGWDQAGYVLDPWESYQVAGWRKSDYQIAAFAFTAAPASYASRIGRPENVGVIGIALFREQPVSALLPPQIANDPAATLRSPPRAQARQQAEAGAPVMPSPIAPGSGALSSGLSANIVNAPLARAPLLGTAHGEREYSYVAHTTFLRRQAQPDEIIRIRYDNLENLIAMGIVRPHRYPGAHPNPFPGTDAPNYVPDPPPFDP